MRNIGPVLGRQFDLYHAFSCATGRNKLTAYVLEVWDLIRCEGGDISFRRHVQAGSRTDPTSLAKCLENQATTT